MNSMNVRSMSFAANTWDAEARTIEALVISRDNGVERRDGVGNFLELTPPENAATDNLIGIPLLDGHAQTSTRDILGVCVAWRLATEGLILTFKLADTADVASRVQKIVDGFTRGASIGYRAEYIEKRENGKRVKTAARLTIVEVSAVPIAADRGAHFRSRPMDNVVETPEVETPETPVAATAAEIRPLCRAANMTPEAADAIIDDVLTRGAPLTEAQAAIAGYMAARNEPARRIRVTQAGPSGDDPAVILERRIEALSARVMGTAPGDAARPYFNDGLADHARGILAAHGHRVGNDRGEALLTRAHTISDFPNLLTGTGQRALLASYEAASSPIRTQLSRQATRNDFRAGSNIRIGELPIMEKVTESGEVKSVNRGEVESSFALDTYGALFGLSRKAQINDDLNAFGSWARDAGIAAAQTEAKIMYDLLVSNPSIHGQVMFHSSRGNVAGSGTRILGDDSDLIPLSDAKKAMRQFKGINGTQPINVVPKFLLVGPEMEVEAERALAAISAMAAIDANPHSGSLTLLIEPRIEDFRWYLFAATSVLANFEHAYLSGASGPQVASRPGWDVLGIEFRVILDFGAGACDWRAGYFNSGADPYAEV